jgi:hypothetical protein
MILFPTHLNHSFICICRQLNKIFIDISIRLRIGLRKGGALFDPKATAILEAARILYKGLSTAQDNHEDSDALGATK